VHLPLAAVTILLRPIVIMRGGVGLLDRLKPARFPQGAPMIVNGLGWDCCCKSVGPECQAPEEP
jgi:hypothetical protein